MLRKTTIPQHQILIELFEKYPDVNFFPRTARSRWLHCDGANLICGGKSLGYKGYFIEPTIGNF